MKKLAFIALALLVALALGSCAREPLATKSTENPNFDVAILFDFDGVRMYRFYDDGHFVYFAKKLDNNVSTSWQQSEGKTSYFAKVETIEVSKR
jgi:hypothetical protein